MLPVPPSLNHAYENRWVRGRQQRVLSGEAEAFKKEVQIRAILWRNMNSWSIPSEDRKIIVHAWFYWANMQDNDANNRWKVLFDALEGIIYPNDAMVLERVQDIALDRQNPRLELEFILGDIWEAKAVAMRKRRKNSRTHWR